MVKESASYVGSIRLIKKPVSIQSADVVFGFSESNKVPPSPDNDATWLTTVDELTLKGSGYYLWTATKTIFTDKTTQWVGKYCLGEAKNFARVVECYLVHESNDLNIISSLNPYNEFQTTYIATPGKYLWSRVRYKFTGKSSTQMWFGKPVCIGRFAEDGEDAVFYEILLDSESVVLDSKTNQFVNQKLGKYHFIRHEGSKTVDMTRSVIDTFSYIILYYGYTTKKDSNGNPIKEYGVIAYSSAEGVDDIYNAMNLNTSESKCYAMKFLWYDKELPVDDFDLFEEICVNLEGVPPSSTGINILAVKMFYVSRTGSSIESADVVYGVCNSKTDHSAIADSSWQTSLAKVTLVEGSYLWSCTKIVLSGTKEVAYSGYQCLGPCEDFADSVEVYAVGDSNETAPTEGWSAGYIAAKGKWLWTATQITIGGTTKRIGERCTGYFGVDGEKGLAIESANVKYAVSTSNRTAPVDTDFYADTANDLLVSTYAGYYLWSGTATKYAGSTDVVVSGKMCLGRCIDLVIAIEQYATSSSSNSSTIDDGSWSYTYPDNPPEGTYIWTRNELRWNDDNGTKRSYTTPCLVGYISKGGNGAGVVVAYKRDRTEPTDKPDVTSYSTYQDSFKLGSTTGQSNAWCKADPISNVRYNLNRNEGGGEWYDVLDSRSGIHWYRSPIVEDGGEARMRIYFTTNTPNQIVTVHIKAFTEKDADYIYLSRLEEDVTERNFYVRLSGYNAGDSEGGYENFSIENPGEHWFSVMYRKYSSGSDNGDYGLVRIENVGSDYLLYRCDGTVENDVITWNSPYLVEATSGDGVVAAYKGDADKPALLPSVFTMSSYEGSNSLGNGWTKTVPSVGEEVDGYGGKFASIEKSIVANSDWTNEYCYMTVKGIKQYVQARRPYTTLSRRDEMVRLKITTAYRNTTITIRIKTAKDTCYMLVSNLFDKSSVVNADGSENNLDIGNLTMSKNCKAYISGENQESAAIFKISEPGEYYVYVKCQSTGAGDYGYYYVSKSETKIPKKTRLWRSDGVVSGQSISWSDPIEQQAEPQVTEYAYRATATVDTPVKPSRVNGCLQNGWQSEMMSATKDKQYVWMSQHQGIYGEDSQAADWSTPAIISQYSAASKGERGALPREHDGFEKGLFKYLSGASGEDFVDFVYIQSSDVWYRCIKTYEEPTWVTHVNEEYWETVSSFKSIATHLLLARSASIKLLGSQRLEITNGENSVTAATRKIVIEDGIMSFFCGGRSHANIVFGVDENENSVMSYYDKNGNLLYNLGPNGLDSRNITSSATYPLTLVQLGIIIDSATSLSDIAVQKEYVSGTKIWQCKNASIQMLLFGTIGTSGDCFGFQPAANVPKASYTTIYQYRAGKVGSTYVPDKNHNLTTAELAEKANDKYFTSDATNAQYSNGATLQNLAPAGLYISPTATVVNARRPTVGAYPSWVITIVEIRFGVRTNHEIYSIITSSSGSVNVSPTQA